MLLSTPTRGLGMVLMLWEFRGGWGGAAMKEDSSWWHPWDRSRALLCFLPHQHSRSHQWQLPAK